MRSSVHASPGCAARAATTVATCSSPPAPFAPEGASSSQDAVIAAPTSPA